MKKALILICTVLLFGFLHGQNGVIEGHITKPDGTPIAGVAIKLNDGIRQTTTDQNGYYQFSNLNPGDYTLTPFYDKDHLNGVDLLDLQRMEQHIYGTRLVQNLAQFIAADINRSGTITTLDYIQLSKLINGIDTVFDNNSSWLFSPAEYDVSTFVDTLPGSTMIQLLTPETDTVANFFGIKVGDVNESALTNLNELNFIRGNIKIDYDNDCIADSITLPFSKIIIKAVNARDTFYTTPRDGGNFVLIAPNGTYQLAIATPNDYWGLCENIGMLELTGETDTSLAIVLTPQMDCPFLEVDVSTAFLRRCFENTYQVRYCNSGTVGAENAYVEIELDPFLQLNSSSIPNINIGNNKYRFELGTVRAGVCATFTFNTTVSCEAELGQTHCVQANIYPNIICDIPDPNWNGASLEVEGNCINDSTQFRIRNVGSKMTAPTRAIVIEDDLVMLQQTIQLDAGMSETLSWKANGSTRYLQVTQPKGHPFSTFAAVAIEGCGTDAGGMVSYGFVNQYPVADESPFTDIDCQDNRGSFDPNDKRAIPIGITENHYIESNTDLEYYIRFQNTGTDTAFTVIIRDTLSKNLDPTSILPGASSHPYKYYLDNDILTFIFNNIALPDSNVNEPASHGFIKFRIQQKPDLPDETLIENRAGIYFDFNEPVITNTVWHTIGKEYQHLLSSVKTFVPNLQVIIAPNPFSDFTRIKLQTTDNLHGKFLLYDSIGRLVRTQSFYNNKFDFISNDLPNGFYSFELWTDNQRISVGKLMIQK